RICLLDIPRRCPRPPAAHIVFGPVQSVRQEASPCMTSLSDISQIPKVHVNRRLSPFAHEHRAHAASTADWQHCNLAVVSPSNWTPCPPQGCCPHFKEGGIGLAER